MNAGLYGKMRAMSAPHTAPVPTLAEAAQWAPERVVELAQAHADLQRQVQTIQHQREWFRRQLFGQKSEKRPVSPDPAQMYLGELPIPESQPDTPGKTVAGHTRRASRTDYAQDKDDSALFFDQTRVPVETITLANPETEGLAAEQFEVIGEKVSHRLAKRPGSYVILKYVRPVIKRRDTQTIHCPAAPVGVLEGNRADVSFLVGLLLDKFAWHLPLYRQHQRLADAGITVSRAWLTQLAAQAGALLTPIYEAQLASIRASRVKAMDETPIKAGRAGPGKMKACYFWPVYGELHEICFPFFDSRAYSNVEKVLGLKPTEGVCCSRTATAPTRPTRARPGSRTRSAGRTAGANSSTQKRPSPSWRSRRSSSSARSTRSKRRSATTSSRARPSASTGSITPARSWRPSSPGYRSAWTRKGCCRATR
jgi:transposase